MSEVIDFTEITDREVINMQSHQLKEQNDYEIDKELAQSYVDTIQKMVEDRDKKCEQSKQYLIEQLEVTADKYRTATGVMEAMRVMRMVFDGNIDGMDTYMMMSSAKALAIDMASTVIKMKEKAEKLGYSEMDQLCNDFYEKQFAEYDGSALDLCCELMRIDLCRNVGPSAEDMIAFQESTEEEIKKTQEKLDELCEKYPEFKELTSTPKEQ